MFCRLVLVTLGCALLFVPSLVAEVSSEERRKAELVFRGFDDTIMRINSGVCRIVGRTVEPNGNVIDDDILIAFDYGARFYRFDNGNLKRTLMTPDFYYEIWHPNTNHVSVMRSPAATPNVTSIHCRLVDIQSVFMFAPVGPKKPFSYQQSRFHQQVEGVTVTGYEELPNGLVRITRDIPQPPNAPRMYEEYIINRNEGYTIQQIKLSIGYTHETSWRNINQTWVPVAYVFSAGPRFGNFGVEWNIEWEQVNEEVDPRFFCLEELLADQEDGALMLSEELGGEPIILGRVGRGYGITPESFQSDSPTYFRHILMWLGILLIILGLGKMGYDYWKRARTPG